MMTLVANILMAASNWLILVTIAKQFNPDFLGQFVLALSICSPAFLFASFKIRTLLVVDTAWKFGLKDYATARLLANFVVTVLILIVMIFAKIEFSMVTLLLVLAYKWCDAWSEFCQSYMRRLHKFEFSSGSLALRSITTLIGVVLITLFTESFFLLIGMWLGVAVLFAIIDSVFMLRLTKTREISPLNFRFLISKSSLARSLVLYKEYATVAVALAVSSLFVYLPNFLLSYQIDVASAGVFATISYFLVAGGILINSISQACTPQLAALLKNNEYAAFMKLVQKMCLMGIIIGVSGMIVSVFAGPFFLEVFYTAEIAKYSGTLNWVMAAAAIRYIYIFLGTSLAAVHSFHTQTKIYATGLITMFISGYVLIEINGIAGAGQAMFAATLVELFLFAVVTKSNIQTAFRLQKVQR